MYRWTGNIMVSIDSWKVGYRFVTTTSTTSAIVVVAAVETTYEVVKYY